MPTVAFVPCYDNHKVINSIILFILNRTNRIRNTLMMNQFPPVKITLEMFCHYQAVLKYVSSFIRHRKEKVIGGSPKKDIAPLRGLYSTLPPIITSSRSLSATTSTLLAAQIKWFAFFQRYPSFLATIKTGCPNIFVKSCCIRIMSIGMGIFGSSYLSNLWHICIIPYADTLCKGVLSSEA